MGDEGVRRELWEGKIPVCFKLDDDEVTMSIRGDRVAPQPCYVSILSHKHIYPYTRIAKVDMVGAI